MPKALERPDNAGGNQMAVIWVGLSKQVQPNGMLTVTGVKIDGLLRAGG